MPTSNQKLIARLDTLLKRSTVENLELKKRIEQLERSKAVFDTRMSHMARASEGILDAFLDLRQAVDNEGYEILINGEVKPIHTHDELCEQIKKYY